MHPGPDLPTIALFTGFLLAACGGESVLGKGIGEAGASGSGGSGAMGAGSGVGGVAGVGGVGTGGATGGTGDTSGGTGGTAGAFPYGCDIDEALLKSCGRTGCHNATSHYANLVLSNSTVGPSLVDMPATHGDIDCSEPGQPFRECTPAELPATCPPNVFVIDSQNPEASWMLRKLDPSFVPESCGIGMPAAPGNGVAAGWSEDRRACIEAWIRSLASGG